MINSKLVPPEQINALAQTLQRENKKIVFTNGCFDILHAGHVLYLESAKRLGDILVIGLNSDASVQRLKGENRPIVAERERSIVLAALEAVDYVIVFKEDTPYELIKQLKPGVLVKGGDWTVDKIVGSDLVLSYGGIVKSLCFEAGISSTNIINRILQGGIDA